MTSLIPKALVLGVVTYLCFRAVTPPVKSEKEEEIKSRASSRKFLQHFPIVGQSIFVLFYIWYLTSMIFEYTGKQMKAKRSYIAFDWMDFIAIFFALAGGFIRIWAYRTLDRFFTYHVTIRDNHSLVTNGPYRYVRHPSYSALMLLFPAYYVLLFADRITREIPTISGVDLDYPFMIFPIFACFMLARRVNHEEKTLHEHFGKKWDDYARTRKRFIPYIW